MNEQVEVGLLVDQKAVYLQELQPDTEKCKYATRNNVRKERFITTYCCISDLWLRKSQEIVIPSNNIIATPH